MTNKGLEYTSASVSISANASHGTGANATVIIGPVGGILSNPTTSICLKKITSIIFCQKELIKK